MMVENNIALYNIPIVTKTSSNLSNYPLHKHNYWEILCYTKNTGCLRIQDNSDIRFDTGTVICVPPNVMHGSDANGIFENICIIDPAFPLGGGDMNQCIISHDNSENDLTNLFRMAYRSFIENESGCSVFIRHILSCIYDILKSSLMQKLMPNNIAEQVKKSIVQNFTNPEYSTAEIYASSGYSSNYIREVFKSMTGMTPLQYLNSLRLRNAEWLLLCCDTEYSIAEVALRSGFNDPLYFSRLFHKTNGVPPKSYKQNHHSTK